MTRYTSIGFKRTHLEAGFDDNEPTTSKDVAEPTSESPKKKRKRSKHGAKGPPASEGGQREETTTETKAAEEHGDAKVTKEHSKPKGKKFKDEQFRKKSSEQRRLKRIVDRNSDTVCFACSEKGHAVRDCPSNEGGSNTKGGGSICYRCGSKKHTLSKCFKPVPEDPEKRLPFASCFVCQGKGHLSSQCPQNKAKGIYPNGGCCKVCGQTDHLARDCGLRDSDAQKDRLLVGQGRDAGADEDDFHVVARRRREVDDEENPEGKSKLKGKIKRLVGGKIIIRVDDEAPKQTKPIIKPPAKVKTVNF